MVSIELISKSLDSAINKCKKPTYSLISLNNQVKHTMNQFLKDTVDETIEHSIVIDNKGNIIAKNDGAREYVQVPLEEASKYVTSIVDDIFKEWNDEVKYLRDNNISWDINEVSNKYHKKIVERLTDLNIQVNLDHNHPSPYGDNLGSPIFTVLSDADMGIFYNNNVQFRIGDEKYEYIRYTFINNLVRSMSCECSNGSRMTLVNKNPISADDVGVIDEDKFNKCMLNLGEKWYAYKDNALKSMDDYKGTLLEKYKDYTGDDLEEKITEDVNNYIIQESKKEIPNVIKDSITEFDKLGVELRVDWL